MHDDKFIEDEQPRSRPRGATPEPASLDLYQPPIHEAIAEDLEGEDESSAAPKDKMTVVAANSVAVGRAHRVARFRGRPMVLDSEPFPHWVPLHKERFDRLAYPILGGVSRSRMNDVFAFLGNTAEDLTPNDHLIAFGLEENSDNGFYHANALTVVWDMDALEMRTELQPTECIWRSPYGKIPTKGKPLKFIMDLANNDPGLYDDIMQSLAPLVMARKPDGVIWWIGDGANGKSTLMDAIYRIFPGQLSSLTVKRLVDGRDTPSLNGTLGNIVKESSEGRVEDTEIYKAIGTHENFRVHKFHSQDDIEVQGNLHHIFSANTIPIFNDKGFSARRRTFIVPFTNRFDSDPTFEQKTFTPEMFGQLITEMCRYAIRLREQGYRYKWSAQTLSAKLEYDTEANNAEEYAKHLVAQGVVGFDSYTPIKIDYEQWCADNGFVPLGVTNLRRAMGAVGFDRRSVKDDERVGKRYILPNIAAEDLHSMGLGRQGMYTTHGFQPEPTKEEKTEVPEFEKPKEDEPDIIGDKW